MEAPIAAWVCMTAHSSAASLGTDAHRRPTTSTNVKLISPRGKRGVIPSKPYCDPDPGGDHAWGYAMTEM